MTNSRKTYVRWRQIAFVKYSYILASFLMGTHTISTFFSLSAATLVDAKVERLANLPVATPRANVIPIVSSEPIRSGFNVIM